MNLFICRIFATRDLTTGMNMNNYSNNIKKIIWPNFSQNYKKKPDCLNPAFFRPQETVYVLYIIKLSERK